MEFVVLIIILIAVTASQLAFRPGCLARPGRPCKQRWGMRLTDVPGTCVGAAGDPIGGGGQASGASGGALVEIESYCAEIAADPEHPYHNSRSRGHGAVQSCMTEGGLSGG